MSCDRCVGVRRIFGERMAEADLKRYRKRGPARTTRMLLEAVTSLGVGGRSILDVGGGIGAIPNRLLEVGAERALLVDASPAYLRAARAEAERQGHIDRIEFYAGDFVVLAPDLPRADIVTLDRVVCCYADMPGLVSAAARASRESCALVYPRDTWWTRAGVRVANALVRITRTGFRAYVHPTAEVEARLAAESFRRTFHHERLVWQVALFQRSDAEHAREP